MSARDFSAYTAMAVDSNPFERQLMRSVLGAFEFARVVTCATVSEAIDEFDRVAVHCLVTEWQMPGRSGLDLVNHVRRATKSVSADLPILMCTGYTEFERIVRARDAGVDEFLAKPFSAAELYRRLHATLHNQREFIAVTNYVGPDRRRRQREFEGNDRRGRMGLSQDQIDGVMEASPRRMRAKK